MVDPASADIAELREQLIECCEALEEMLRDAGWDPSTVVVPEPGDGDTSLVEADPFTSWSRLTLGDLPGVKTMVQTIKTPLEIIVTLLKIIAGILEALAFIIAALADPYRALILAAYEAVNNIIQDFINAGVYVFADAPGIGSPLRGKRGKELIRSFEEGRINGAKPNPPLDGFQVWASHFLQSFDDPGDEQRPILSDGAAVTGAFYLAAAPNLAALMPLMYMLGQLLNIDAFKNAFERFNPNAPDPKKTRARTEPTGPDWNSRRLQDIAPPVKELMRIPEALKGLLLGVDSLVGLLGQLGNAIKDKVAVLEELVTALDAVIAMIESLAASGLYVLPVMTTEGPEGLKKAFLEAKNRPEGLYVVGVCMLAAGPWSSSAKPVLQLFGAGAASDAARERFMVDAFGALERGTDRWDDALEEADELLEQQQQDLERLVRQLKGQEPDDLPAIQGVLDRFAQEVGAGAKPAPPVWFEGSGLGLHSPEANHQAWARLIGALLDGENEAFLAATGRSQEELLTAAAARGVELADWLEVGIHRVGVAATPKPLLLAVEATREAQRHGARSLILGLGPYPTPPVEEPR